MVKKIIVGLLLIITTAYAGDTAQQNAIIQEQYYRDLAKHHFDLAVTQFNNKDMFGACSNLRISWGYIRHFDDVIAYEHVTLLLDKMCSGDR